MINQPHRKPRLRKEGEEVMGKKRKEEKPTFPNT